MSFDDADRNRFLVTFVDYSFDDFGGNQPPVYPGLSTVWGSLARSKVLSAHISMKLQAYLCSDVHISLDLSLTPELIEHISMLPIPAAICCKFSCLVICWLMNTMTGTG